MATIPSNAAKIMGVVAVVLTVVLAFVGYRYSREYAETSERANQKPVAVKAEQAVPKLLAVVAVKPLPAYKPIAKDGVQLVEVAIAPKEYFTSVDQVIGKEPLTDIDGGAPITQRYFADGNILAKTIPPGFQAVSVEISDVIAVGGFVRPGDIVDVLLYLRNGNEVQDAQARVLLKETRVLAYQELVVERPEGLKDEEQTGRANSNRRQRTAVLAVPEAQTTRLMLGANLGELRLALHGLVPESTEMAALPADVQVPDLQTVASSAEPRLVELAPAGNPAVPKKVPDKAITAAQLSKIELPPGQKKIVRQQVFVYRGTTVETVTP
ncbi:MAG: Flp pilus assembly protein CpaB [Panacagrimonas sp.]